MVDYDFYVNSYLGYAIPEKAFPGMAARAQEVLAQFGRMFRVVSSGQISEKMAVCAMAEKLYERARSRGVKTASVGSVSVSYSSSSTDSLSRELLRSARIYLDIHRGVA